MKITKAAKAKVDAYIVKPFRAEILKEKLNTLMNGGIDESSAKFEEEVLGLHGGSSVHIEPSDDGVGSVEVEESAQEAPGVYTGGEFDEENPPVEFDITQLNIIFVLKLANSYKRLKKFDLAIKLCLEADDHFPDNADVLFNLGHCYYLTQMYPEAEEALRKAIKVKPYHVESFTLLNEMQRLQKTGS
ncbi:MAG: tetratricopeptide repeat protein [Oligoflexia bacterium]|nr:tetratricopeptide repeat protein [Oligoflexia bacterium]